MASIQSQRSVFLARLRVAAIAATAPLALLCAGASQPARADSFTIETALASGAEIGQQTSHAIDAQGTAHVMHLGYQAGSGLWYSRKSSGTWTHECVDNGLFGGRPALALDAAGEPHVARGVGPDFVLSYRVRQGTSWSVEFIDTSPLLPVVYDAALALDAQENPHIAYRASGALVYVRKAAGSWSAAELIDVSSFINPRVSLALDGNGNPHIAFNDGSSGVMVLAYARKLGGTWFVETVDDGGGNFVGGQTGIAVDPQGQPHIAYQDRTLKTLKYARKVVAMWVRETVDADPSFDTGLNLSFALDATRDPHIAYERFTSIADGQLRYARKIGSEWLIQVVDPASGVGDYTSIALDSAGNPRISYQGFLTTDLYYATGSLVTSVPSSGGREVLLVAAPNPFAGDRVEVRYRLPAASAGSIDVLDASGRRVTTLRRGSLPADGTAAWDGRDDRGRPVAAGAYFLSLATAGARRVAKVVLVR